MNVAEATRQYQVELENQRAAREHLGDILSAERELQAIADDVQMAEDAMERAWLESSWQQRPIR